MAHHGPGILLKTTFDQKGNKVLRTVFDKKYIYYQTITDYVPPLFLVINYEEAAFTGRRFLPAAGGDFKTDDLFRDNVKFVESLLVLADCGYDACQVTFLRLETVGDFQRTFETLYPLWNVGVGALVRLAFTAWPVRARALKTLASNAANNRDVYTINYAANVSAVTVVDYLEPLFAYCVKMAKTNGHDAERWAADTSGGAKKKSHAAVAAAAATTEMFEINFCIVDEPADTLPKAFANDRYDDRDSIAAASSVVSSKKSGHRKKNGCLSDVGGGGQTADADRDANKPKNRAAAVLEKQRAMCGSLSVHDVRPYFSMLNARRLSRLFLDQLEELPVLVVHCERHFCSTTCCVVDRTDNRLTVMHVYYCWDDEVFESLTAFADTYNERSRRRNNNEHVVVAVSPRCSENIEARLKMLEDLKNVIWKDSMNAYVRLAIDEAHDQDMLARNFYEPLVFHVQRHSADLETEIRCSVKSSQASGSIELFRNSIALDCSRLCNDLDPKTCNFARTYRDLVTDSTLTCNGYVRLDRHTTPGVRQNAFRLLEHRQNVYTRLVSEFRSERVLEIAFDMASELRLGLLDVFGLTYTNDRPSSAPPTSSDDLVFDSVRASNYVFVETLLDSSSYFGACGSVSACNEFFAKERRAKPLSQSVRGLYRHDMIEFDLQSAYPSVASLYNVSPETTAVVERDALKTLDRNLEAFVTNNSTAPHRANVMTTVYNQIGHVNDVNSGLVIVSLRPEIYVGVLARTMDRLVLKRKTRNRLLDPFYKKLANVVYGCTGKAAAYNDLFSPQCASAIRSLCKSVMLRTLQNVPPECVLFTQTDGALLYAGPTTSCQELKTVVSTSLAAVVSDVGNVVTAARLVARVRSVDLCLLIDQNRYLMLYADGKTVCKGQERQSSPGARITETLLSAIAEYVRDEVTDRSAAVELNDLLATCFGRLNALNGDHFVDWFVTTRIPSSNEVLYSESSQIALTGLRLKDFSECSSSSSARPVNTSIAKFGDTIAVWPVLVWNDGEVFNEFRATRPAAYNTAVMPNYVLVTRHFIRYWIKWLFAVRFPDQDEVNLMRMFHAVCKKHERQLVESSLSTSPRNA